MKRLAWVAFGLMSAVVGAQEDAGIPGVDEVIAPLVRELAAPTMHEVPDGLEMAVTGSSEQVQGHVRHGIELVLAGWDFEAYRHFCAGLAEDPECLLAHWGTAIALAQSDHEFTAQRDAAVERMDELARRKVGSELERGYVFCLLVYYRDGAAAAADSFRKLAANFPNDPLSAVFAAVLGRGGFDAFGDPTPDQQRSENLLRGWMSRQPGNPVIEHAYLVARAEAPSLAGELKLARELCRRVPAIPTFRHLLGHYEWRSGNFREAASSFGHAAAAYDAWMQAEKLAPADCPGWVQAEAYRSVALASAGDFDSALAAAGALAKVPFDPQRVGAPGSRWLMWEGRTLAARLLLARRGKGDAKQGLATLPAPGSPELLAGKSDAIHYYQGLATVLEGRMALEKGDLERAGELTSALTMHGTQMAGLRDKVVANGELSHWRRALPALQVLAAELRGDIALAGPAGDRGSAYNWYLAAVDRQEPGASLMPSAVLVPMRVRVGDYLRSEGRMEEAEEAYREALDLWPNNQWSLKALEGMLEKSLKEAGAPAGGGQ